MSAGGAEHVHLGEHHPGELGLLPHHQGADGRRHSQGAREGTGTKNMSITNIMIRKCKSIFRHKLGGDGPGPGHRRLGLQDER